MTAPTPPPGGAGAADERAAQLLLDNLRTEIGRADSKAAVLMTAVGLTTSSYSGLLAGRGWSLWQLTTTAQVLCWMGAASLTGSLYALLLAVLPRYGTPGWQPGMPLTHFADIRRACDLGTLAEALPRPGHDPAPALLGALAATSRIAYRKHVWIRRGLLSFAAATLLLPVALLIG
ncbi:Pycsar system effector family protein [Streptomyces sp. NPDC087420]|uniref:Pycsar system effector family protein n=1 Tax=Streptomyces sp. NPDC087420 TaxID=3365785 RepID=UPI003838E028